MQTAPASFTASEVAPAICPNCEQPLLPSHRYCPECGQAVRPSLQPLRSVLGRWWDEEVGWDGKLLRTLRAMLRPGLLTAEWVLDRRQRYTDPLRLYLLLTVVYLLFFQQQTAPAVQQQILAQYEALSRGTNNPEEQAVYRRLGLSYVQVIEEMDILLLLSVPLFALSTWWMYRRRAPLYVHHLVLVLHLYAASMVIGVLAFPVALWQPRVDQVVIGIGTAGYLLLQLQYLFREPAWRLALSFVGVLLLSLLATAGVYLATWMVNFALLD